MSAPSAEGCATQLFGSSEKLGRTSPSAEPPGEIISDKESVISAGERSPRKESSSEDKEDVDDTVAECSPCRRYEKGKEKVQQRHVPGIDETWIAMDLEDGVEVLWNEIHLNDEKNNKDYIDKLMKFFEQLVTIDHPNIVRFHRYWRTPTPVDKIVFVTEYMFSGSLKQFLKKCKTGNSQLTLKTWTRWCTEILGALNYLHGSQLVHADISTDTVFVQFNGIIKLGRISPYTIIQSDESSAPRQPWGQRARFPPGFLDKDHKFRTAYDVLCFGYCALEMADVKGVNGDNGSHLTPEAIEKRLASLNDPHQKDLIKACLHSGDAERPTAHQLLFHRAIFEVPSLKLFAAHNYICSQRKLGTDALPDLSSQLRAPQQAQSTFIYVEVSSGDRVVAERRLNSLPTIDVDKLLESVRLGVDPVSVFSEHNCDSGEAARREKIRAGQSALSGIGSSQLGSDGQQSDIDALSDDENGERSSHGDGRDDASSLVSGMATTKEHQRSRESRRITQISVSVKPFSDQPGDLRRELTILLRMDDRMNRQLSGQLDIDDTCEGLADELVSFGLVNRLDRNLIVEKIAAVTSSSSLGNSISPSTIVHFDQHSNNYQQPTATTIQPPAAAVVAVSAPATGGSSTSPEPLVPPVGNFPLAGEQESPSSDKLSTPQTAVMPLTNGDDGTLVPAIAPIPRGEADAALLVVNGGMEADAKSATTTPPTASAAATPSVILSTSISSSGGNSNNV